jgi:hypothetical protein
MGDPWITELEWLTRGVRAVRIARETYTRREAQMARLIEIKGLGNIVAEAKKGIGELRGAAGDLNVETAGLKAEINDLTDQVKQHRKDLRFEAETLGNGGGDLDEKKPEPPVKAPEKPAEGSPEVGHGRQTFQARGHLT